MLTRKGTQKSKTKKRLQYSLICIILLKILQRDREREKGRRKEGETVLNGGQIDKRIS